MFDQLGNEVDGLASGAQQARNLQALHNLTLELWPDASKRPVLLGPDASHQDTTDTKPPFPTPRDAYVYDYFVEAGKLGLPIVGATLHKYIETDTQRDTNATFLDETTARFRTFQEQVGNGWAVSGNTQTRPPRPWGGGEYNNVIDMQRRSVITLSSSFDDTDDTETGAANRNRATQWRRSAVRPQLNALGRLRRLSVV